MYNWEKSPRRTDVRIGICAIVPLNIGAIVSLGFWATASLSVWASMTLRTKCNQKTEEMAQPKQFDINKFENILKNSARKARTLSYWKAAVEHGKTFKAIDENLASNDDNKQIAQLRLRRTDAINRGERLIKAVENAIKLKYRSQIPVAFAYVNKEIRSRFVEMQQQNSANSCLIPSLDQMLRRPDFGAGH